MRCEPDGLVYPNTTRSSAIPLTGTSAQQAPRCFCYGHGLAIRPEFSAERGLEVGGSGIL